MTAGSRRDSNRSPNSRVGYMVEITLSFPKLRRCSRNSGPGLGQGRGGLARGKKSVVPRMTIAARMVRRISPSRESLAISRDDAMYA